VGLVLVANKQPWFRGFDSSFIWRTALGRFPRMVGRRFTCFLWRLTCSDGYDTQQVAWLPNRYHILADLTIFPLVLGSS
jgi:hypothetical protein